MNPFMKTLKKIAAAYNGVSLILRIAIGLVVGVILALVCPGATWLKELGNLFVGALKGIAPVRCDQHALPADAPAARGR